MFNSVVIVAILEGVDVVAIRSGEECRGDKTDIIMCL